MRKSLTSAHGIRTRVGSTSGIAHVLGNAIFFEVAGQGHPIVFLHDGLLHRAGFDAQIDLFSASFTILRYDRPGYGDSGPPTSEHSHVEVLAGLLDYLGPQAAILIGGSRGGGIAIDFALRYPERVLALVLVGAPLSGFAFSDHLL